MELVDIEDLKSSAWNIACGFKSHLEHQINILVAEMEDAYQINSDIYHVGSNPT